MKIFLSYSTKDEQIIRKDNIDNMIFILEK